MSAGPATVVVVGSLHHDIIVDAPDRPRKGETVTGRSWAPKFGGKGGNQAVAACRAGASTAMVGAVGRDDFGTALLTGLDKGGVDRSRVTAVSGVGSGMSVAIFDDGGDYGAVIVSGANLDIKAEQADDDLLRHAKVLVLQNEIPEAVNEAVAKRAREHGTLVILNAAPARPFETTLSSLVDILVVNAVEAEMLGSNRVDTLAAAETAAAALCERCGAVVVTAGGDGVAYHDSTGLAVSLPSIPVDVASTHGAGDVFVGTFAACLAAGADRRVALTTANRAAATHVAIPESER